MLKEGVGPTQSDENEAIMRGTESVATIEAALYLTGELLIVNACAFTVNQEVVSVPAQVLRLEVNLNH
jgi:hypothetical protein